MCPTGLPVNPVQKVLFMAIQSIRQVKGFWYSCRLEEGKLEMGLGIHGEPGAYKRESTDVDTLIAEVNPCFTCKWLHGIIIADTN